VFFVEAGQEAVGVGDMPKKEKEIRGDYVLRES
jgi:hypothetical protein